MSTRAVKTFPTERAGDGQRTEQKAEPIPFRIGDEEFLAPSKDDLPGLPLMELAAAFDAAEDESVSEEQATAAAMGAWARFLHAALGPEQYGRLRATVNRHRWSTEQIMELAEWIVEASTGVPLDELSSSLASPGDGSQNSTGASPFAGAAGS